MIVVLYISFSLCSLIRNSTTCIFSKFKDYYIFLFSLFTNHFTNYSICSLTTYHRIKRGVGKGQVSDFSEYIAASKVIQDHTVAVSPGQCSWVAEFASLGS